MKACEQKNCLHYDLDEVTNCDSKNTFDFCDAKIYKGNRIITQMDMNEIIDKIAEYYPEDIFRETTFKETTEFSQNVREYIGRASASMARFICDNIRKELEKYFEEN